MTSRFNSLVAALLGFALVVSQVLPIAAQDKPGPKQDKPGPKAKPDPKPNKPDAKPDRPGKPDTKPDKPDAKPDKPDAKPDRPGKPDRPDAKPDKPDAKPDKPGKPDAKPDRPDAKPDKPDAKPDKPDAKPDKPGKPDAKPDRPDAKPDAPDRAGKNARQGRKFEASKVKTEDLGVSFKEADKGVRITNIEKNSVFVDSGFRSDDVILSVNGQNVTRQADFMTYLFNPGVTGRVPVIVLRDGVRETVYLRPTTIIRDYERVVVDDRNPIREFGLVLDGRNDGRLIVDRVLRDSRADHAGIKVDDEILAVNDRDVESREELARMLEKFQAERIDMEVRRERSARVIEVEVLR
jgi:predicted metalloprotease with PDZ domain